MLTPRLSGVSRGLNEAATVRERPRITGCACTAGLASFHNHISDTAPVNVADALKTIHLVWHPTTMNAAGDMAVAALRNADAVMVSERALLTR